MVKNIYVARHGLRANLELPPTGIDGDPRLTDEGFLQAQELAAHLSKPDRLQGDKITAIYSSPFYRCLQTAKPASQVLSVPIWVEPGVGEYYTVTRPTKPIPWSATQSKVFFETIDLDYTPLVSVSRSGETREDVERRVDKALKAIIAHADASGHDTILIVTHAAIKIVISEVLTGQTVRAGTCSLDKHELQLEDNGAKRWKNVIAGDTSFLSGGEQLHWSFDMSFEAGSIQDEASRKQNETKETEDLHSSLVSLDTSALGESELPDSMDPSEMAFAKLETDRPLVQIGTKIYEGEWQRIVGTEVYTTISGEALGKAKYRIKLRQANIEHVQSDQRTLPEKLADIQKAKGRD